MIVIVGSRSSLKIEATRIAFESIYYDVVVKELPIKSGVSLSRLQMRRPSMTL